MPLVSPTRNWQIAIVALSEGFKIQIQKQRMNMMEPRRKAVLKSQGTVLKKQRHNPPKKGERNRLSLSTFTASDDADYSTSCPDLSCQHLD